MKHGPNVNRLIIEFMAREAIPTGAGISAGFHYFLDEVHRKRINESAERNAMTAIQAMKSAPDAFSDDDEIIAKFLLDKIAEKKAEQGFMRKDNP